MVSDSLVSTGSGLIHPNSKKIVLLRKKTIIAGGAGSVKGEDVLYHWIEQFGLSDDDEWTPAVNDDETAYLFLTKKALYLLSEDHRVPSKVSCGYHAIGSGADMALAAYAAYQEHGGRTLENMKKAVTLVCKINSLSRLPIQIKTLKELR